MSGEYPLVNFTVNIPQFENQTWITNADFRWSSYSGLHTAANKTLHWIFPKIEDYKGFRLDPNDLTYFNTGEDGNVNVDDMVWENRGPLAFGIVGLFLAFLLTVVGIGWCVLQCCSCCSSKKSKLLRANKAKSNKNTIPKIVCGVLMIVWRVLFVTFLIALFVSNEQFKDAIDDLPKDIDNGVVDTETFINLTQAQINSIFIKSYDDLAVVLNQIVDDTVPPVPPTETADSFKAAKKILEDLDATAAEVGADELKSTVHDLELTLDGLQSTLKSRQLSTFEIKAGLPDLIEETRAELKGNALSLTNALNDVPIQQTREDIKEIEEEFNRAKGPAFHSINALNLFFLLIIVVLTVGAILGIFSKTAKIGSSAINCALLTIFITVGILWIFAIAVFLLAGGLLVVLPGAFDNVSNNGSLVQPKLRAEGYVVPGYASILQNCKQSKSAYVTFDLVQVYNISDIQTLADKLVLDPEAAKLDELISSTSQHLTKIKQISSKLLNSNLENSKVRILQTQIQSLESDISVILSGAESVRNNRTPEDEVNKHVQHYADFVYTEVNENVGNCEPLYNVLTSTLHVFSYKVGSPIGSYWWSLNFMLLLFYPIIITAIVTLRL